MEQLKCLEKLQEVDLKIDSIKKDQKALPAGLKLVMSSIVNMKGVFEVKKAQENELEKVRRQTSAALELNQDRLARANSKLESVCNSQEFQAATKEIEQLKKLNLQLEEQNKKTILELETCKNELETLESQLKKLEQDRDEQNLILSGKDAELKQEMAIIMKERATFSSQVEPKILSQYERVRGARDGTGIVSVENGRCKGCNMMVPPQLYNELQRCQVLHSCPSCHRLFLVTQSPSLVSTLA